jgi:hypothetical protein
MAKRYLGVVIVSGLFLGLACKDGDGGYTCFPGNEDCPCVGSVCLAGLECVQDICVAAGAGGSTGVDTTSSGEGPTSMSTGTTGDEPTSTGTVTTGDASTSTGTGTSGTDTDGTTGTTGTGTDGTTGTTGTTG